MHIRRIAYFAVASVIVTAISTAAVAMDNKVVQKGGPDLTKARALIKSKNWQAAVGELNRLTGKGPNADVYNLLGFSLRKQGKFEASFDYYGKALKLDPKHLSAHEYLGELHIQKGEIDKAKEQAAILAKLCPDGCEEREDLDKALAAVTK